MTDILGVPKKWCLIDYICREYPEKEHIDPELVHSGCDKTLELDSVLFERNFNITLDANSGLPRQNLMTKTAHLLCKLQQIYGGMIVTY